MLKGTIIKVGDVVKFGRVPFLIKESSLQKGAKGEQIYENEDNETLERNITDIES